MFSKSHYLWRRVDVITLCTCTLCVRKGKHVLFNQRRKSSNVRRTLFSRLAGVAGSNLSEFILNFLKLELLLKKRGQKISCFTVDTGQPIFFVSLHFLFLPLALSLSRHFPSQSLLSVCLSLNMNFKDLLFYLVWAWWATQKPTAQEKRQVYPFASYRHFFTLLLLLFTM